jgi:hypothetical protein
MPSVKLHAGVELENLSAGEVRSEIDRAFDIQLREQYRGIKWMRLPEVLQGKASGGVLLLNSQTAETVGPRQGYIWSVRALIVDGLTSGATPDVVNIYRNDNNVSGPPLWQLNGNSFGATFGKMERTMMSGDFFVIASVGTFAATGTIRLSGEVLEVPAEMVGKLI